MYLLLLLFSALSFAVTSDSTNLLEQTFARDNTYCSIEGVRFEVLLRGAARFTDVPERKLGETVLIQKPNGKVITMPIGQKLLGNFRFFRGKTSACSKSLAFKTGKDTLAILFLKQNFPEKGKLLIQLFNYKTLKAGEFIQTSFITDHAEPTKSGFVFRSYIERPEPEMGKVTIHGGSYIFQDREFPQWIDFHDGKFVPNPKITFKHLPWRKYFANEETFLKEAQWSEEEKSFKAMKVYFAVSHAQKKKCVLVVKEKLQLNGSEAWHCK